MFLKATPGGCQWLIVGLGNPGKKYEGTRHNVGFDALDHLAKEWGIAITKARFEGLYGQGVVAGNKLALLKPQTFMNLSGHSVGALADFFKLPADHVIVLCDDITQVPGKLRIRASGSAGGHNGLKDIIACLGTEEFPRVRLGVGEKPHPEYDLADWVLGRLGTTERKAFEARYGDIEAALRLMVQNQLGLAQSRYNG